MFPNLKKLLTIKNLYYTVLEFNMCDNVRVLLTFALLEMYTY